MFPRFLVKLFQLLLLLAPLLIDRGSESFILSKGRLVGRKQYPIWQPYKNASVSDHDRSKPNHRSPIPVMPSDLFTRMAHSQLELLAHSLTKPNPTPTMESKVESIALYLPQENVKTGQLEFTPVVLYPDPSSERLFIASDAGSGQAPTVPKTLTKLPGFAHATTLLPGYPMMYSDQVNPGVGVVEEVMCDPRIKNKPAALSVPLLSGSQTVGVLLVSPSAEVANTNSNDEWSWSEQDRQQISRAAQSLSMALSMDNERNHLRRQNNAFREGLSDSLHQVKNPLQALRTYGKILQRQLANTDDLSGTPQLLELTRRLMTQSERVIDLMTPMDTLVERLDHPASSLLALEPAKNGHGDYSQSLMLWEKPPKLLPWENETLQFAKDNSTVIEFSSQPVNFRSTPKLTTNKSMKSPTVSTVTATNNLHLSPLPAQEPSSTMIGDLEMEMTFVTDVLEPIFSGFEAIAMERRISFQVEEESAELPGVLAAPRSLQEAVSNVLDNAFKYVVLPKPGLPFIKNPSPRVRVRMFANEDFPGVTILVEDNGPGICDLDREHIFTRGFRGEATSNAAEGTGIGLDISQTLMRRMGGVLEVVEQEGIADSLDGAVFRFRLFRQPKN